MAIPPGSLQHSYDFSDPACYPGSGSTVFDLTANNLDLPISGPTFVSDGNSSYFNFSGSSNYIGFASGVAGLGNVFSISIWSQSNSSAIQVLFFAGSDPPASSAPAFYYSLPTSGSFVASFNYGTGLIAEPYVLNAWENYVYTADGTTAKLYKNGVLEGSVSQGSGNWPTGQFTLGYTIDSLIGKIALFDVYDSALSAGDITTLYNDTKGRFDNLVRSYDFSDPLCYPGTGNTVFDLSGSEIDLPISGATYVSDGQASYFQFSGSSSYIGKTGVAGLGTVFSISIWSQTSVTSSSNQVAFFAGNDSIPSSAPSFYYNLPTVAEISASFNYGTGLIEEPYVLNTWENYTYTADGTTTKLYKNGSLVGSVSQGAGNWPTGQFYIGYTTDALIGKVALLDIYNVALGSTAVSNFYAETAPRFDNLVASYDFSDPLCYPGTGNTVFDLSGSELDLPISGATYAGTGQSKYFSFDGVNDYIGLQSGYTGLGNTFTISEWINPNSPVTFGAAFSSGTNTGSITGPTIYTDSAGGGDVIGAFNFGVGTANTSINANQWSLITFTGDGTTVKLYKNGALVDTASQTIGTWNNGSFLMGENAGGSAQYSGKVALLEVYNTALGSTAITNIYNNEVARFGSPPPAYSGIVGGRQFAQGFNG